MDIETNVYVRLLKGDEINDAREGELYWNVDEAVVKFVKDGKHLTLYERPQPDNPLELVSYKLALGEIMIMKRDTYEKFKDSEMFTGGYLKLVRADIIINKPNDEPLSKAKPYTDYSFWILDPQHPKKKTFLDATYDNLNKNLKTQPYIEFTYHGYVGGTVYPYVFGGSDNLYAYPEDSEEHTFLAVTNKYTYMKQPNLLEYLPQATKPIIRFILKSGTSELNVTQYITGDEYVIIKKVKHYEQ